MASPLKTQLSETMKTAMKSQDKDGLTFARNLHAAIRKKEVDDRVDLDDAGVRKIVGTLIKQRQESIDQFKKGGRDDLVQKEEAELKFLQSYLPPQLSDDELKKIVDQVFQSTQAKTQKDMGLVMKALLPQVEGRADARKVSELVKARLASA